MISVELLNSSRSAAATGPFGSRTPSEQPPSVTALSDRTAATRYRISRLVCVDSVETAGDSRAVRQEFSLYQPGASQSCARGGRGRRPIAAAVGQQRRQQHQQGKDRRPD